MMFVRNASCLALLALNYATAFSAEQAYSVAVQKVSAWNDAVVTTDNSQTGGCSAPAGATLKLLPFEHPNYKALLSILLMAQITNRTVNMYLTDQCKFGFPTIGSVELN